MKLSRFIQHKTTFLCIPKFVLFLVSKGNERLCRGCPGFQYPRAYLTYLKGRLYFASTGYRNFCYFTDIKFKIFSRKNRIARPGTSPLFSTRQPLILPPKSSAQLLTLSTFQYLYTTLELKSSLILTLTLWLVQL